MISHNDSFNFMKFSTKVQYKTYSRIDAIYDFIYSIPFIEGLNKFLVITNSNSMIDIKNIKMRLSSKSILNAISTLERNQDFIGIHLPVEANIELMDGHSPKLFDVNLVLSMREIELIVNGNSIREPLLIGMLGFVLEDGNQYWINIEMELFLRNLKQEYQSIGE